MMVKKAMLVVLAMVLIVSVIGCAPIPKQGGTQRENDPQDADAMTLTAALMGGVLQNHPTGYADYDVTRHDALTLINDKAVELNAKTTSALPHVAALADALQVVWDMPRGQIRWPVLYNINTANISYLKTLALLDSNLTELPTVLEQTAQPLIALEAARALEDAAVHLMIAGAYLDVFASMDDPVNQGVHLTILIQAWQKAESALAEMIGTAQQLGTLVTEAVETDRALADAETRSAGEDFETLKRLVSQHNGNDDADLIIQTMDAWMQPFGTQVNDTVSDGTKMPGCAAGVFRAVALLDSAWQGEVNGEAQDAADRLNDAVNAANAPPPKDVNIRYSTSYNTDDAEAVIGLFLILPLGDAMDTESAPAAPPAEDPVKPTELLFPTDTNNVKVNAFHTVMNATLEAAAERGYDPEFATAVMDEENDDPGDRRDMMDTFFSQYELELLAIAALNAAEDRNQANADSLLGDVEFDKLLAIMLTQASAQRSRDNPVDAGNLSYLPENVVNAVQRISGDDDTASIVNRDVPPLFDDEGIESGALAAMLGSKDTSVDTRDEAAKTLAGSIQTQIKTGGTAATSGDSRDLLSALNDMLGKSDAAKEIRSMVIAQAIGDALSNVVKAFEQNPDKAINEGLKALIKQVRGIEGAENWTRFLEGLQGAARDSTLWQAIADGVLSGDIVDKMVSGGISLIGNLFITDKEVVQQTADAVPTADNAEIQGEEPAPTPLVSVYDYSGTYQLELTLVNADWTIHPYDQAVFGGTEDEWKAYMQDMIDEAENADYMDDWRNPSGKINIEHDVDQGTLRIEIIGSEFQDVFIRDDDDWFYDVNLVVHTAQCTGNTGNGGDTSLLEISFDVGLDGEISIVGSHMVINRGKLADVQRTFDVAGF